MQNIFFAIFEQHYFSLEDLFYIHRNCSRIDQHFETKTNCDCMSYCDRISVIQKVFKFDKDFQITNEQRRRDSELVSKAWLLVLYPNLSGCK